MRRRRPMSEITKRKIGEANKRRGIERAGDTILRFWSHVDKSGGCWIWLAGCGSGGYGKAHIRGVGGVPAHRASWMITNGPIPAGMFVCHHCDVRNCVNPAQLFLGTQRDNIRDASEKGRLITGDQHHMRRPEMVKQVADKQRGVPCPSRGKPPGWRQTEESKQRMRDGWARRAALGLDRRARISTGRRVITV